MNINIGINICVKLNITPTEYCVMYCLHNKLPIEFLSIDNTKIVLSNLQKRKFLRILGETVLIYPSVIKELKFPIVIENLEEFVKEYRDIFPTGVKTGGRPVRGDKTACLKKMELFIKANPEYTKEDILEAARIYVDSKKKDNYQFMICADYLMDKKIDGVKTSVLASIIDDYKEREIKLEGVTKSFYKEI